MKSMLFAAIVAALSLLGAAKAEACESVAIVAPSTYSAVEVAQVVAPVVYRPQVLAVEVQSYAVAQPIVVQEIRVKQQRQRRQPVKAFVQAVTPNRRHCH